MKPFNETEFYKFISAGDITFKEIVIEFEVSGHYGLGYLDQHISFWGALSKEFVDFLLCAEKDKKIQFDPTNTHYRKNRDNYKMPIAKNSEKYYKELHWLPVVINPGSNFPLSIKVIKISGPY